MTPRLTDRTASGRLRRCGILPAVEGSVKAVFDAPMASCAVREGCGRERAGGDVGSLFGLDLVTTVDAALDHGDGGELREAGLARI
jgi:hypothetical protein